jgi:hypothetical protein
VLTWLNVARKNINRVILVVFYWLSINFFRVFKQRPEVDVIRLFVKKAVIND